MPWGESSTTTTTVRDHYKCYKTTQLGARFPKRTVDLVDQFGGGAFHVDEVRRKQDALQRQGHLNQITGLYKVTDGVYQVRGLDLANFTVVRGKEGWIVFDPLTAAETPSPGR